MSAVVGIDLSSRFIDLVKLDEDSNRAEWHRVTLDGAKAWDRTLSVRDAMPPSGYWDDVYLAAAETPFPDQQGVLRRVQGAVMACVPSSVLVWEANASEWKAALGLKTKPTPDDVNRLAGESDRWLSGYIGPDPIPLREWRDAWQNARDAYCIALWARDTNARAGAAA